MSRPHPAGKGRETRSHHPHKAAHPRERPDSRLERKLSPEEIAQLPMESYTGTLHVVDTPEDAAAAIHALRRERLLGFDTETRPAFRKGEHYPPSLLQLAGEHAVWIFKLASVGIPPGLAAILADPDIVKAGVSNARDLAELQGLRAFTPAGFVDLGHSARQARLQHHGLRGMAAVVLGCRISKSAQLTNWAQPDLPHRALQYAATDAWIGRRLYEAMHPRKAPAAPAAPRVRKRDRFRAGLKALLLRCRR